MQRVRIVADTDYESPRDWGTVGTMYCWHSRYNLGDEHEHEADTFMRELACEAQDDLCEKLEAIEYEAEQVAGACSDDWSDAWERIGGKAGRLVESLIDTALKDHIILPLALFDHSGISMSIGYGSCPWDSGQVGWIVCTPENIQKEWAGDKDLAEKSLHTEVEVYDQYLTGDVYGFIVEEADLEGIDTDEEDWEDQLIWNHEDSCWGFYGHDPRTNGMSDHLGSDELLELACNADCEWL